MYEPFVLGLLVCRHHSVSESEDSVAWVPEICAAISISILMYAYINYFVADYYESVI